MRSLQLWSPSCLHCRPWARWSSEEARVLAPTSLARGTPALVTGCARQRLARTAARPHDRPADSEDGSTTSARATWLSEKQGIGSDARAAEVALTACCARADGGAGADRPFMGFNLGELGAADRPGRTTRSSPRRGRPLARETRAAERPEALARAALTEETITCQRPHAGFGSLFTPLLAARAERGWPGRRPATSSTLRRRSVHNAESENGSQRHGGEAPPAQGLASFTPKTDRMGRNEHRPASPRRSPSRASTDRRRADRGSAERRDITTRAQLTLSHPQPARERHGLGKTRKRTVSSSVSGGDADFPSPSSRGLRAPSPTRIRAQA